MPRKRRRKRQTPVTPDNSPSKQSEVVFTLDLSDEDDDGEAAAVFTPVKPMAVGQSNDSPTPKKKRKKRSSLSSARKHATKSPVKSGPQWKEECEEAIDIDLITANAANAAAAEVVVKQAPCDDPTKYCGFCCELDRPKNLLTCSQCGNSGHQSCMKIGDKLANNIRRNPNWLCIECKLCSVCHCSDNDDMLLFCDSCDDGIHIFCHSPPILKMPTGAFECPPCKAGKGRRGKVAHNGPPSRSKSASQKRSTSRSAALVEEPKKKKEKPKEKPKEKRKPRIEGEILVTEDDEKMFEQARATASKKLLKSRGKNYNEKKLIQIGQYEIETWYLAPYPEEYIQLNTIYLCEFCIKYMKSQEMLERHQAKCEMNGHPPGNEIYRDGNLQMWEVDGQKAKIYCQNICLLAKLFLDHKTLYYDVEPFLFYVLTERDEYGAHIVGYFSKEKNSILNYNISCILTLPYAQRKGYGTFLIDFSYLLTRVEKKTGSPEKPLSKLGEMTYKYYWKEAILRHFANEDQNLEDTSIYDIGYKTGMTCADVISTMKELHMLKEHDGNLAICKNTKDLEAFKKRQEQKPRIPIDQSKLRWIPLIKRPAWA